MKIDTSEENRVSVTPEDRLDLILIYYILKNKISNLLSKIYWQNKSVSLNKTTRLRRLSVSITLEPYDFRFSYNMRSLRVTGRVVEAWGMEGVKGRRLGIDINIGKRIYLEYKKDVLDVLKIVKKHSYKMFIILVIDSNEVALARVSDTISVLEETYIPTSKFYDVHLDGLTDNIKKMFQKIKELKREGELVIVAVNAFTKKLINRYSDLIDYIIEGDFSGTYTGIIQVLRSNELRKGKIDNPILNNIETYEDLLKSIYNNRIIYGVENIKTAIVNRGITTLYVNYQLLLEYSDLIEDIVIALKKHINVSISDKKDFIGLAVDRFGGIVGIY